MTKVTPMMGQYREIKKENPDAILFFRMGDFYEMFADDAILTSRELDITLTGRSAGEEGRVPMCGVPHHAAETYIARLIDKGYRVAICEQMEDPKQAKGLVKRDVIRIISPGTVLEDSILAEQTHNYLAALYSRRECWGFCYTDISTGEFKVTQFDKNEGMQRALDELARIRPKELLLPSSLRKKETFAQRLKTVFDGLITELNDSLFAQKQADETLAAHFQRQDAESLFLPELARCAAGATLAYLISSQKRSLSYIHTVNHYDTGRYMLLDGAARRNLELTATLFNNQKKGSLLWVLDKTCTVMGKRLIREWIENPLLKTEDILRRQDGVRELYLKPMAAEELKEFLRTIRDLERLSSRIAYGSGTPRDLAALGVSLEKLPDFRKILFSLDAPVFREMAENFDDLADVRANIHDAIDDDPPLSPKEGHIVRPGFDATIDEYRDITKSGKKTLLEMEAREREETGIKSLKIGYNRVFGYYIEVSNSNLNAVPQRYIRKQTLTNGERFFTEELKNYENKIIGAEERLCNLEYDVFCKVRDYVTGNAPRIQLTAQYIAVADVLRSFAAAAQENRYCCPEVDHGGVIEITDGRHPTVERLSEESFIANDTLLDNDDHRIAVITGPNMAGKSTYMRQVALIVLMAQIGSFVPALKAHIGVVDRIFTRIGAADDLVGGSSTFMVEMRETANILRYATAQSLIILDEIGRGTSTFDGLAIAWACIEYLADASGAPKTLFATHYHELTTLEEQKATLKNYAITVEEINGELVFLRKIKAGRADRSYGIQVARLAGLPLRVITDAKRILRGLEKSQLNDAGRFVQVEEENTLFRELTAEKAELLEQIENLDLDNLKPMQALNLLAEYQDLLKRCHE